MLAASANLRRNLAYLVMNLWTHEQLAVTVGGPSGVRELLIDKPFARVGSHPNSEVVLDDPGVAKRALYLHATSDGVFCLDLDIEDSVAQKRGRWMLPHDVVQLGPYSLSVRLASGAAAADHPPASPVAWGSAGLPLPVINVHCQRLLKDKRRFRARLNVVGRRPQCALQLRGARVSSFHCLLFWDQRRLWAVDLLSSNGTQLNGEKFDCGEIQLNDRLDVGEFTLVYYRWSPRRSMQPGWLPEHDAAHDEHEAEAHGSAPLLDAASPPSGIEADLALATHLAEEDGSDIVRDAAAPAARQSADDRQAQQDYERLREELVQELARLADEREQLRSQAAAVDEERERWNADREEHEAAQGEWYNQRLALELQASDLAAQVQRLQTELAAARLERESLAGQLAAQASRLAQERGELEARIAELAQRLADQATQAQSEAARLVRERMAAEAAKGELQAERESLAAQLDESARQIQRLKAELTAANDSAGERQAAIEELVQQRDAALAQAAAPRPVMVSPEQEAIRQHLAADVARLTQERDELHAQWTQSSERFAQQIAQLTVQVSGHAEERDAAAMAHDQWQRERQRLNDQLAERGQQLAASRAELSAAAADLAQRQADLNAAVQQKDAQIARLNQDRRDLQTQWTAATQQLAVQVERSQEQASRLAELRRSMETERAAWHAERDSQAQQLAERAAQLAERSAQLEHAKQSLAATRADLARRDAELDQTCAASQSETVMVSMTPAPADAEDDSPAWAEARNAAPPEAAGGETLPVVARTELPGGRRSKAQKHEIAAFVGDRLIDLEQNQRRRSLILWASVAAGTVVLSALIFGGWYFLQ